MIEGIPFYFDCDTGIDDALALAFLLNSPEVDLVGIGTAAGNTTAEQAAANTAGILALAGRSDIPVAVGARDPLAGKFSGGDPVYHGSDGAGGVSLPHARRADNEHAVNMLVRLARQYPGYLHIVATAPLTNVALALKQEPNLPDLVADLTIMGGAVWVPGNTTDHAEANFANDPEAARIVLAAGFRTCLVPLDVTHSHHLIEGDCNRLIATHSPTNIALGRMLRHYIGAYGDSTSVRETPLHDPLAAAIATGDVAATQVRQVGIDVIVDGDQRGRIYAADLADDRSVTVVVETVADTSALVLGRIMGKRK